jgi:hypothetical protein
MKAMLICVSRTPSSPVRAAAKLDAAACVYCSAIRTLLESRLSEQEFAKLGDLLGVISTV